MLSFKPTFSLSTFTFIKGLLSSSSLSAIRVVSSAYLRLLIFLPPMRIYDQVLAKLSSAIKSNAVYLGAKLIEQLLNLGVFP